jgi:hypothetical protein
VLKSEGAHALYIEGLSIRTETVASARGHRPWVPDRAFIRVTPLTTSGQATAPGDAATDDGARFNGDPEE